MGCLLAKSCKSMVEMLEKSCKSMVEMLEKSCKSMVEMLAKSCKSMVKMLATNLTISTLHHLCNLREIVDYGICTGFDEALA